jgi:hypothetical protein
MLPRTHDQRSLTVGEILESVEGGFMALPDFQRRYRWNDQKLRGLLASIFSGWPAGLLLLMECPPTEFFAMRPLEGGPEIQAKHVEHLILDGQQRITALTQAFRRPTIASNRIWCLDLDLYLDAETPDDLEAVFVSRRVDDFNQPSLFGGPNPRYLPLWMLMNEESFFAWRSEVAFQGVENEANRRYGDLTKLWVDRLAPIRKYAFPTVVLGRQMPLSTVAGIFEKMNTSGMPLDTFDLVVAHVYRDGKNLRQMWEIAAQERPIFRLFVEADPQIVVEAVALKTQGDTRRDSLLSLRAEELWEQWPDVIDGLERACWFLSHHAGIRNARELPHRALLVVLTTLAWDFDLESNSGLVLNWVFTSALKSRFDAAVNTRVVAEYRTLAAHFAGRGSYKPVSLAASDLTDVAKRISSVWLGMQALIRSAGPLDFPDGMLETPVSGSNERVISLIRRKGPSGQAAELAIGVMLLEGPFSERLGRIGAKGLYELLIDQDPVQVERFLRSQVMPPPREAHYLTDSAFSRARVAVINERLRHLMSESGEDSLGEDPHAAIPPQVSGDVLAERYRKLAAQFGPHHPEVLRAGLDWDEHLLNAGDYQAAQALSLSLLDAIRGQPLTVASAGLTVFAYLARSLTAVGQAREAEAVMSRMTQQLLAGGGLGEASIEQLEALTSLLRFAGPTPGASRLLRELADRVALAYGPSDPRALSVHLELAAALRDSGNYAEARNVASGIRDHIAPGVGLDEIARQAEELILSMT